MKAEELMIGDWVLAEGKLTQVTDIDKYDGINRKWIAGCENGGCIWEEYIEPISLTPEIFEKSGFTLNEEENPIFTIRVYSLDADDVAVIQRPKGGWKFMYGKETSNQQNLFFGDGKFVCMPIQYVHELQHILKVCGIDKEIVL